MASLDVFQAAHPRLFSLAYRTLGSSAEADAVLHEVQLRWLAIDARVVPDPDAWLLASVDGLCLERLSGAAGERPALQLTAISGSFMSSFERLEPLERAVYLLREMFDYSQDDVARALDLPELAVRHSFHRAVDQLARPRSRLEES